MSGFTICVSAMLDVQKQIVLTTLKRSPRSRFASLNPMMTRLLKRGINSTVDAMGFSSSLNHHFDIHELAHALKELDAAGKLNPLQTFLTAPTMPEEELYDVVADPYETKNLAGSAEHRETLLRAGALAGRSGDGVAMARAEGAVFHCTVWPKRWTTMKRASSASRS